MLDHTHKKNFLDLFYHDLSNEPLKNNNSLNLFTLKIKNNSFAYDELIDEIGNQLHYFALSRNVVKELKDKDQLSTLISIAKDKLREHSVNEGELGEILLYCLLESHLNAPKILSKMELKTSNNDYVKGSDGVHLLKISDKDYQLVLGESKLYSELSDGVSEAFKSLKKLIDNNLKKTNFEVTLVNSNLLKESFDTDAYEILKKIIIPSAKEDKTNIDYSFGVFLGYDVLISEDESKLNNNEFRNVIREKIKKQAREIVSSLNFQIQKKDFIGYDFYVYIIPFTDLKNIRKKVIEEITK